MAILCEKALLASNNKEGTSMAGPILGSAAMAATAVRVGMTHQRRATMRRAAMTATATAVARGMRTRAAGNFRNGASARVLEAALWLKHRMYDRRRCCF